MVTAVTIGLILLLALSGARAAQDTALANRLVWAGLDREAELHYDSAFVLYRAARDAAPTDLGVYLRYRNMGELLGRWPRVRREYEALRGSRDGDLACLALYGSSPTYSPWPLAELTSLERRFGETECSAYYRAYADRNEPARVLASFARAARFRPDRPDFWYDYALVLGAHGRWDEAERVIRAAIRQHRHPMDQTYLYLMQARIAHQRGASNRTAVLRRAIADAAARDGRPGLRMAQLYQAAYCVWAPCSPERLWELINFASEHGAWPIAVQALEWLGRDFIDRGEPAAALPALDRAAAIADTVGSAQWQAFVYTRRGRACAKLGRLAEAERDLRWAAAGAREAREPYWVAEAYHNLAHVYESMGRLVEASRAADQYIQAAGADRLSAPAMMSYHDAGMIRWKAGWHAAAHAAFREMVKIIDEQRDNNYWAGEYYERIGDWRRAIEYYRRGLNSRAQGDRLDRTHNLAGLARAHEALGQLDSAEAAARAHDGRPELWGPLSSPLLPGVLARRGRLPEAVRSAAVWAARQVHGGNIQGAAIAHLQLAELLRRWGKPTAALGAARTAESLAVNLNLTDELIDARRLGGVALLDLRQVDSGLATLRAAAALADARPTAAGLLGTHVSLGDALGDLGRADQALAAYERAARVVETMTGRFDVDLDRARFRDRHLAPFDGALRVLLRAGASGERLEQVVRWSQRRKAMALALATRAGTDTSLGRIPRPLLIADLQRRLRADEALIDYVVIDSLVAAIVVTNVRATVVRLESPAAAISALVERLRGPLMTTYVGRLDLARAPYDLAVAEELHQRLLAPLLPLLGRRSRLILVPDGVLHHVPFEALVVRRSGELTGPADYAAAVYVVDANELSYLPSAQFLEPPGKRKGGGLARTTRLLAVTYEASGGAREAEAIVAAWPRGLADVLSGPAATETAVRANGRGRALLHFATHARADDRDPLSSYLRLVQDAENDGYLHLTEISQAKIRAPLVVLSACETLKGRLFNGEGMMGLARAFLAGGAGAVVATRWPVGPATADFMAQFYRALTAGRAPASALDASRALMRRNPQTAHPFYWAGFILILGKPA
ncbi:MAG: CHAT domain-containing protein [Gemmatimonadetes bacterium]|nr:CHAT domain-containing protein [Gemmatimonadota bacterium]